MSNNSSSRPWWKRLIKKQTTIQSPFKQFEDYENSVTLERLNRVIKAGKNPPPEEHSPLMEEPKTKLIKGREFKLVPNGLSSDEVGVLVDELVKRNEDLEKQVNTPTMTGYIERLMEELARMEESIKQEARRDAESEANNIYVEARKSAQEIILSARREASELATKEAEGILSEAKKRAEIVEGQIRIQAQLLLAKARNQVEDHIKQESTAAYNRVQSALNAMMIEAEKAESEWKQRTTQLWSGEEIKLALGEVELSTSSIIQEALGVAIHENKTEVFQTDSTSELTQTGNEIPVNEPKSSEPR
jgi:cell division septum initiation protein DivIVA